MTNIVTPSDRLTIERRDVLTRVDLNCHWGAGTLGSALSADLQTALHAVNSDPNCEVLILTGADNAGAVSGGGVQDLASRVLQNLRPVTIAVVESVPADGSSELALASDLIISTGRNRGGELMIKWAICPGPNGQAKLAQYAGLLTKLEADILAILSDQAAECNAFGLAARATALPKTYAA